MRVCAIVPAFNESRAIADVVSRVREWVADVVVVDDGSTDGTGDAAARAGATVLRHEMNRGKGHAVRTGLAHVLAGPWTHVLLMDGDGQHRPADVPRLLEAAARADVELVVGAPVFRKDAMPRARYYSNVIGSWALSRFVGVPVGDSQSGFRVIRCDALRRLTLTSRGYEIETEMLIRLRQRGARIASVPVEAVYGLGPSKLRPVRDTTRTCFLAVRYRFLPGA
jgi:glycosyltransferase involved in cell wall biosynthesis